MGKNVRLNFLLTLLCHDNRMQKMIPVDTYNHIECTHMTESKEHLTAPTQLMVRMSVSDNLKFIDTIENELLQLILTSPPYNIGKIYEKKLALDVYVKEQEKVIKACVKKLRPGGSICWQVGNYVHKGEIVPLDILLYPLFVKLGLKMRNRIIWHFEHGLHCTNCLSGRHETICWFTKGDDYYFNLDPIRIPSKYPNKKHFKGPNKGRLSGNPKGKNPSDVWIFPNVKSNHVEKTIHPCQFPIELVERLVLSLTRENDSSEEYISIAWERYRALISGSLKTRPMDRPIYNPALPKGGQG